MISEKYRRQFVCMRVCENPDALICVDAIFFYIYINVFRWIVLFMHLIFFSWLSKVNMRERGDKQK